MLMYLNVTKFEPGESKDTDPYRCDLKKLTFRFNYCTKKYSLPLKINVRRQDS